MAPEGVKRKISAILSADVVGYSKLMEADEEGTVRTVGSYRKTVSSLILQRNGGYRFPDLMMLLWIGIPRVPEIL